MDYLLIRAKQSTFDKYRINKIESNTPLLTEVVKPLISEAFDAGSISNNWPISSEEIKEEYISQILEQLNK